MFNFEFRILIELFNFLMFETFYHSELIQNSKF
jgi:hypothetical protein